MACLLLDALSAVPPVRTSENVGLIHDSALTDDQHGKIRNTLSGYRWSSDCDS